MVNADAVFRSHVTLTYRARTETWELDEDRNRRMVRRSKEDLHRFLRCLRREGGDYVWAQEFQERGVIHYHVLFVEAVAEERAAVVWARVIDQLQDKDVLRHGAKVRAVENDGGARGYVSRYVGKGRQKFLPPGVDNAGRWWGRSRSLRLMELEDVVSFDPKEPFMRTAEVRVLRAVAAYLTKVFSARAGKRRVFRGGAFVDFGGELSAKLQVMVERLREYYGQSPESVAELMAQFGWEPVEGGAELMAQGSWEPIQGGVWGGDGGDASAGGAADGEDGESVGSVEQKTFDFGRGLAADVAAGGADGGREAPEDGGEVGAGGGSALCAQGEDG
jgi:hypothetical protein